jgi:hypothetical protein
MTDPTPTPARNAKAFNRICLAIVLVLVSLAILARIWNETKHHDFGQFYMGATMARLAKWDAIYPEPVPASNVNPGWPRGSTMKPAYAAAAAERGVDNTFRYIQLPPNALLYYPLALLSFQNAYRLWHAMMIVFIVLTAAVAGQIYDEMRGDGRRSMAAGFVTLLVGCSPLMIYTARVSNTGPLLAACFGAAVLGMLRPEPRRPWGTALAVTIGGMTKYAPGVLVPVLLSMRRWRTLAWIVALSLIITLATVSITGTGVWLEFWRVLWPPLQKSSDSEACQSLFGFVSRVTHHFPVQPHVAMAIKLAQLIVLVAIFALLWRPKEYWDKRERIAAASAALMAWMLIFSPVAWQFYHVMLTPLWGWLIFEAVRGRAMMRIAVAGALLLTLVPTPSELWGRFPEPIASRQLFSAMIVLALGLYRLGRREKPEGSFIS